MTEKAGITGATGGAIGMSAFAAALGTCCVAPWVVSLLGVSGAVALMRLSFLKPYLLGGAVALLVLSFWLAYRPAPVCADGSCETQSRRKLRIGVWIATGVVGALVVASYSNYESGERDLPLEVILKLVSEVGVSPSWLLTGKGAQQPEDLRESVMRSASSLRKAVKSLGVKLSDSKHDQILAELIVRDVESAQPQDAVPLIRLVAA